MDILAYTNTELISWLSGVFEDKNNMHITVSYNLDEGDSIQILSLFQFIMNLMSLKDFEQVIGIAHENKTLVEHHSNSLLGLTHIDLSNIREYIIPTTNRREHYRWQFCGPGRTILRHVKVRGSFVKEYIRKGKRLASFG